MIAGQSNSTVFWDWVLTLWQASGAAADPFEKGLSDAKCGLMSPASGADQTGLLRLYSQIFGVGTPAAFRLSAKPPRWEHGGCTNHDR
jgi:hypothetical protein